MAGMQFKPSIIANEVCLGEAPAGTMACRTAKKPPSVGSQHWLQDLAPLFHRFCGCHLIAHQDVSVDSFEICAASSGIRKGGRSFLQADFRSRILFKRKEEGYRERRTQMSREEIYKEMEEKFGLVPSMFKAVPDSSLERVL